MWMYVKTLEGKTTGVEIEPSDNWHKLLEHYREKEPECPDDVRLVLIQQWVSRERQPGEDFCDTEEESYMTIGTLNPSKQIDLDKRIDDYGWMKEICVMLIPRLNSGQNIKG
mmetsp:Transcript_16306/g.25333  ORF Transcript_16306/g.25333 Transcript_16306/m.25333 type:complete len:112 (-) Transcript_16306:450-785(-)|eukprot:CAMPEP_0201542384 /NCGR_PEP_ID=MMETSP0161_2-20130828/72003_1 /ASSEMBLY_ACC=CAM_ASM_000251 /TAXON_ID=180227 /ORGANISM="Neoparamoeba aestuarina, Strain SoJaBio B1-5/56/2" /LENGTH=111 /DNA_ID=CAMNT_0047950029 /DNA_START=60 /DNA_END=395 /DNA_ORIENTATION=+